MKLTEELILAVGFFADIHPKTWYGLGLRIVPADSGDGFVILRQTEQHFVSNLNELVLFISQHSRQSGSQGARAEMTTQILEALDPKVLKEFVS